MYSDINRQIHVRVLYGNFDIIASSRISGYTVEVQERSVKKKAPLNRGALR